MGRVTFQTSPPRYRHWRLSTDGPVATLVLDVDEAGGLVPGYDLKLNSYDLGVGIELSELAKARSRSARRGLLAAGRRP